MASIGATINIYDGFSSALEKLKSGLGSAKQSMNGLKSSFKDGMNGNIQSPLESAGQQAEKTGRIFKSMLGANIIGTGITKGIGLITSSMDDAIKRVDTLNNSTRSFQNMGFSAKQTKTAMNDLDKAITGLPTAMNDAVSNTQLLAASTGDIGKSTKIYKAMNDGILGFGGSSEQVKESVIQLSQAFSNGKVDAQTWNSMINGGMGPVLNSIAKQMGTTTGKLKDGLSGGTISAEKFQDALISLDEKGGGGMKSLSKIAQDSTKGLGTSMTNFKTAVTRAVAGGLDALSKAGLTDAINGITQKLKDAIPTIQTNITALVNNAKKGFESLWSGFSNTGAISSIKNTFEDIGKALSNVFKGLSSGKEDPFAFLKNIGSGVGNGVKAVSGIIDSIANAIAKLSPNQIKGIATAMGALAGSMLLMKGLSGIGKTISGISEPLAKLAGAGKGLSGLSKLTAIAGKLTGLSGIGSSIAGLAGSFAAVAPVILGVAAALAVAGFAIYAFKTNLGGFGDFVSGVFSALSGPISSIVSTLQDVFSSLGDVFNSLKPAFMTIATIVGGALVVGLMAAAVAVAAFADALSFVVNIAASVVHALMSVGFAAKAAFDGLHGNFGQMKKDFSTAGKEVGKSGDSLGKAFDFSNLATTKVLKSLGQVTGLMEKSSSKKIKGPTIGSPKFEGSEDPTKALEKKISGKKIKGPQITKVDFNSNDPLNGLSKKVSSTKIKGPKVEPTYEGTNLVTQMQKNSSKKVKGPQIGQLDFSGGDPLQSLNKKVSTAKIKGPTVQKPTVQGGDPTADIKKKVSSSKIKGPTIQKPTVQGDPTSDIKKKVSAAKIPAPKIAKPKIPAVDTSSISSARSKITSQMNGIKSSISSAMRGAASAARSGMAQVAAAVRSGIQAAVAAGRSGASQMRSIGVMIGQGLAQGMQSQVGAVAAAADALVSQANKAARAKAQVHSPSRLFAEIGGFIGQGLAMGMDGTRNVVAKSGSALINAASGSNGSVKNPYSVQTGKSNNVLNSVTNHSKNNDTGNSSKVVIESGAIQINSTGNADYDGERLVAKIEEYLINRNNASLS